MGGRNSPLKFFLHPTAYANDEKVNNNVANVLKMLKSNFTLPLFPLCEQEVNGTFVCTVAQCTAHFKFNFTTICNVPEIEQNLKSISEKVFRVVSTISQENKKYVKQNISSLKEKFSNFSDEILNKLNSSSCNFHHHRNTTKLTYVTANIRICQDLDNIEEMKIKFLSDFLKDLVRNVHPHWSKVTFAIMFLPGLVVGMYAIFSKGLRKSDNCPLYKCPQWFQQIILCLSLLMIFIFPIGMLLTLVFESVIVFKAYRGFNVDEDMLKTLLFITEMATALEAFFESGPQIITKSILLVPQEKSRSRRQYQ